MGFQPVLVNVLVMLAYMSMAYGLVKWKKAASAHAKSLSALLLYVCGPCLIISSFQNMEYSMENFGKAMTFMAAAIAVMILFFLIVFVVFRKKFSDARYRILNMGSMMGNVGFFGLPIITALFPGESVVGCYSTMYMTGMNFLVFTIGVFLITGERKYISLKSLIFNPTTLSVLVAIPLYLLKFHFPETIGNTISLLGKMSTPVCMFILGMRLASMKLKEVFAQPFSYAVCALKLIGFPLFAYLCVFFLPFFDHTFKVSLFALSAAPTAAVVLSLAELHEMEQKLTANVVLMTTLFSLITMPLMMLIVA